MNDQLFAGYRRALLLMLFVVVLSGMARAAERPRVYVGLPPQRWLVQQLASNRVEIGLLLAPGQNPHTFEPAARQVKEMVAADGYLLMGLPFERALLQKLRAVNPGLRVFDLTQGIPRREQSGQAHVGHGGAAEDHDDGCGAADPHVWLTPAGMGIMASNAAVALSALDPAGREWYEVRRVACQQACAQLDAELRALLAPVRGGLMLTYHASWGYFADAYGLRQVAVEAEGRPPTARQLAALMDLAMQEQVRYVFTEPPYDPKPCRTVARQIGAEVAVIDPLAEAWDRNLRAIAAQVRKALERPPARQEGQMP
jgi:zinc transport system substrate-binding protein